MVNNMRVYNKQKAIKKATEYIELLQTKYSRSDASYLYIYTWVDNHMQFILDDLKTVKHDGWYYPRTDWFSLLNDLDDAVRCNRISSEIKENAMSILTDPDLMMVYNDFRNCFR